MRCPSRETRGSGAEMVFVDASFQLRSGPVRFVGMVRVRRQLLR